MRKIVIFEHNSVVEPGSNRRAMEDALLEGDPIEVEWLDSWEEAREYLLRHPGRYWTEPAFVSRVQRVEGCYAVECEIDDENGDILQMGDMEFCTLRKGR